MPQKMIVLSISDAWRNMDIWVLKIGNREKSLEL